MSVHRKINVSKKQNIGLQAKNIYQESTEDATMKFNNRISGILDQLKTANLSTVIHKLKSSSINNEERLDTLVKSIYDKAVSNFEMTGIYAYLCKQLWTFQVVSGEKRSVNFGTLLTNHCQQELKKVFSNKEYDSTQQWYDKMDAIGFWSPSSRAGSSLKDATGTNLKKIYAVVFLGELFLADLFTVNIMRSVITKLFSVRDEDSWECLCILLFLIGEDMEAKKQDLSSCLRKMQEVIDKKKPPDRAGEQLQLVIQCRKNNWRISVPIMEEFYCERKTNVASRDYQLLGLYKDFVEDDDSWAMGTLNKIVLSRHAMKNQMRQAKLKYNS